MIHLTSCGRRVYILEDLLPYILYKGYPVKQLEIASLKHKGLDIDMQSLRFKRAALGYPIVVLSDMTVVDGRHRILKASSEGRSHIDAYVIDKGVLELFMRN